MTAYIIPGVIAFILIFGLIKGTDVFGVFVEGAKEGLRTSVNILPSLVALLTCIGMFQASGGLDLLTRCLAPAAEAVGIPEPILPLAFLRPISGSGALVIFEDILKRFGADSQIGRIAGVLMGSTETTFYTIAVYYGAVRIQRSRHTLVCSLGSDLFGFLLSAFLIRVLF